MWQSCPPTAILPAAVATIAATSVAGGHSRTSDFGSGCAAISAATSAKLALVPFIFQLPAANFLRIPASLPKSGAD